MSAQVPQAPEQEIRSGTVSAAIWRSEESRDGRTVTRFSIRVQKRYRDKETGEWKTTEYFFPDELPKLRLVAEKAYEYMALRETTNDQ